MPEFTHQFRAMGTEVGLWLWYSDEFIAQRALHQTEQYFAKIEAHLSRFKVDSELSRLNYSAGEPFTASPLLFELVETALTWRERTNGIFDPTVFRALLAHGYDRSFEEVVNRTDQHVSTNGTPPLAQSEVKLNRAQHTITLPQGVGVDLGGIAKGWTVQQAGQKLGRLGPALVDAGGDIACIGVPPTGSAWLVGIDNPLQPNTDLAQLIQTLVDTLRPQAETKGLVLEVNTPPHLTVSTDADSVTQILLNLLENAIAYTDQGWINLTSLPAPTKFVSPSVTPGLGFHLNICLTYLNRFTMWANHAVRAKIIRDWGWPSHMSWYSYSTATSKSPASLTLTPHSRSSYPSINHKI